MSSTTQSPSVEFITVPAGAQKQIADAIQRFILRSQQEGIGALTPKDQAELYILNKAHNCIQEGVNQFNIVDLQVKFLDGFTGRSANVWRLAFYAALRSVREHYINPHTNS